MSTGSLHTSATSSALLAQVRRAIYRTHDYFLKAQYPEGYWWGELESNATMEAEQILLTHFLDTVEPERERKLMNSIRARQGGDGGWPMYYGGPGDLSSSVECYFALKLAGVSPDDPAMRRARAFILDRGGVPNVRVFTKIWLALFGQWDWEGTPLMSPETMLLPSWAPLNIYSFASWARATIVPMLILLTERPIKPVPPGAEIDELYPVPRDEVDYSLVRRGSWLSWEGVFLVADKLLRAYERVPIKPFRGWARRKAVEWIVAHQEADGSWGGIQPPWVYSLLALKHVGYPNDHPVMAKGIEGFKGEWSVEQDDELRVQACLSPVWDTCLAMLGLLESDVAADHHAIQQATRWLIHQQVRVEGDWCVRVKGVEPGGWPFEFENDRYPDVDDTAIVLMDLELARLPSEEEPLRREAVWRGLNWVFAMQSANGGWAAFDKDSTSTLVSRLPFSDFGEAADPPTVDVTAHVLEMLGRLGYTRDCPAVQKAINFILERQEDEGPWFGRWGVNYIYGTGAVLPALQAVGEDMRQPYVRRAVEWLVARQNPDGGWGESVLSYVNRDYWGRGESTPSQTAWALIALLAAGEVDHRATEAGVRYLLNTQREDGTWDEPQFTGCGFPGYGSGDKPAGEAYPRGVKRQGPELSSSFLINYHLYRNYFPLWALGRYERTAESNPRKEVPRVKHHWRR